MSRIQINCLQAVGSELFESSESFVTELEATEAHAIYGGGKSSRKRSGRGSRKKSGRGSRGRSGRGSSSGRGFRGNTIVIVPFPFFSYH
jgi:hypothetical protein